MPCTLAAVDFFNQINMLVRPSSLSHSLLEALLLTLPLSLALPLALPSTSQYGCVTEFCTPQECPVMCAGPRFEYHWQDGVHFKKPTKMSAPGAHSFLDIGRIIISLGC